MNRFLTTILILFFFATQGFAQTCDLAQVATKIQTYADAPFSARAWRVLQGLGDPGVEAAYGSDADYESQWQWKERVAGLAGDLNDLQQTGYNCRLGYALDTLNARVAQFGPKHPYVRQWLVNQNFVLKACRGEPAANYSSKLPVPGEVEPALQLLQSDDRAYQEAAMAFYADPATALPLFKAIGQTASPHKAAARYNVANILANAKDLVAARVEAQSILSDPALKAVHKITEDLVGYIANLSDTAEDWSKLIDTTIARINPPLMDLKSDPAKQKAYAQALFDIEFAGVRHKHSDWWIDGTLPANATISKALLDASRKYPMVTWMMAGQTLNQQLRAVPIGMIGDKWLSLNKDYVNRVLTIKTDGAGAAIGINGLARDMLLATHAGDADGAALLTKATALADKAYATCGAGPETAAAGFMMQQALRVAANAGRYNDAYGALQKLPHRQGRLYINAVNDLGRHILATGNITEGQVWRKAFLTPEFYAAIPANERDWTTPEVARIAAWLSVDEAQWIAEQSKLPSALESPVLNLLPAAKLRELQSTMTMKVAEKALVQRATWLRDHLRGVKSARGADSIGSDNVEIAAALAQVKQDFPKLKPNDQLLMTMLRQPRFGLLVNVPNSFNGDSLTKMEGSFDAIDNYDANDKNWWCPLQPDRHLGALRSALDGVTGFDKVTNGWGLDEIKSRIDDGLTQKLIAGREKALAAHPMVKAISWAEIDALAKVPSGPKYLTDRALKLAGLAKPGNEVGAEALGLAVRTTRYGCRWNGGHKAYSKPAQEMLKTNFSTSPWLAKTPYWFDCMHSEWDKDFKRVQTCNVMKWPSQKRP